MHVFIPRTNSEKGSSKDSMAVESIDNWENFGDGGGDNDPLEITSISSDMSKEVADSHENTSRLYCLSDVSTSEGIVIKPDTSQQKDSDALDKLGGELAAELFEVKDEPLGDWRAVSDFNTQEDSDLHNDMCCSQERDAQGESNGKIASEHITIKDEPLENWEDAEDNGSLKAKKKSEDKEDQVCSTMVGLTRKAVTDRYFSSGDTFENVVSTMIKEYQQRYNSRKTMKKVDVSAFKHDFCKRWRKCHSRKRFEKLNSVWLEKELKLFSEIDDLKGDRPGSSDQSRSDRKRTENGKFEDEQSDGTKRRKTEETRKDHTADVNFATQVKLRESGRLRAKHLCKKATLKPPTAPVKKIHHMQRKLKTFKSPTGPVKMLYQMQSKEATLNSLTGPVKMLNQIQHKEATLNSLTGPVKKLNQVQSKDPTLNSSTGPVNMLNQIQHKEATLNSPTGPVRMLNQMQNKEITLNSLTGPVKMFNQIQHKEATLNSPTGPVKMLNQIQHKDPTLNSPTGLVKMLNQIQHKEATLNSPTGPVKMLNQIQHKDPTLNSSTGPVKMLNQMQSKEATLNSPTGPVKMLNQIQHKDPTLNSSTGPVKMLNQMLSKEATLNSPTGPVKMLNQIQHIDPTLNSSTGPVKMLNQMQSKEITVNSPTGPAKMLNQMQHKATLNSPTGPVRMLTQIQHKEECTLTPHEALSILLNTNMSKTTYNYLRRVQKDHHCKLYPSYKCVLEAKKQCHPPDISVTEFYVHIPLQSLLDHTTLRLLHAQKQAVSKLKETQAGGPLTLEMVFKYGFCANKVNGASPGVSETQMLALFVCPMKAICKETKTVLWQNPAPYSPVYSRPHRIKFTQKKELLRLEEYSIESQIQNLTPNIEGDTTVHYVMIPTMVDSKISQDLLNVPSSSPCFQCQRLTKSSHMNKGNLEYLKYSTSPFHLLIDVTECVLHLAYHLKRQSVGGKVSKSIMAKDKERIQSEFKRHLGINIRLLSQGRGNTNCGKVARRFFSDPIKCSAITGVDEELIRRFSVLLFALNSGYTVNAKAYEAYAEETAKLYVDLYFWYEMPVPVHKMLMHGSHVIEALCIGHASKEGIEARSHHTRKSSRIQVNTDLIHWLLAKSDPMVAAYHRPRSLVKYNSLSPAIRSLLEPHIEECSQTNTHSDDEEEDDEFV
ncbi:uncharacterized protein [Penaeus vannamei]